MNKTLHIDDSEYPGDYLEAELTGTTVTITCTCDNPWEGFSDNTVVVSTKDVRRIAEFLAEVAKELEDES